MHIVNSNVPVLLLNINIIALLNNIRLALVLFIILLTNMVIDMIMVNNDIYLSYYGQPNTNIYSNISILLWSAKHRYLYDNIELTNDIL